jgi:hypothetical protein
MSRGGVAVYLMEWVWVLRDPIFVKKKNTNYKQQAEQLPAAP